MVSIKFVLAWMYYEGLSISKTHIKVMSACGLNNYFFFFLICIVCMMCTGAIPIYDIIQCENIIKF